MVAAAVCVAPRGGYAWVGLVCSCVGCLSLSPVCGRAPVGCVLPSRCGVRALCFPSSVTARMDAGPSRAIR